MPENSRGDASEAQGIAATLVRELDPENLDVIEDEWNVLRKAGFQPAAADNEHRFIEAGTVAVALGVAVGCAVGRIFSEAAKDVLKEEAVRLWRKWRTSPIELSDHDVLQLVKAMDTETESLGLPGQQRTEIRSKVEALLQGSRS